MCMSTSKKRFSVVFRLSSIILLLLMSLLIVSAADRRNNNVFGDGGVVDIVDSFAKGVFELMGQEAFFSIAVFILIFLMFKYLLQLALSFLPDDMVTRLNGAGAGAGGANSPQKVMSIMATILALIITLGTVGFMGYDNYEFSLDNVYQRVQIILLTIGTIGIWTFSSIAGILAYIVSMNLAKKRDGGAASFGFKERIGIVLITIGATSFVANGIMDRTMVPSFMLLLFGAFLVGFNFLSGSPNNKHLSVRSVKKAYTLDKPVTSTVAGVEFQTSLNSLRESIIELGKILEKIHSRSDAILIEKLPVGASKTDEDKQADLVAINEDVNLNTFFDEFSEKEHHIRDDISNIKNEDDFARMDPAQKRSFNDYLIRITQFAKKARNLKLELPYNYMKGIKRMKALWK